MTFQKEKHYKAQPQTDGSRQSKDPIKALYEERRKDFQEKYNEAKSKFDRIVSLRLIAAFTTIALFGYGYYYNEPIAFGGAILVAVAFFVLIRKHGETEKSMLFYKQMVQLNKQAIQRLQDQWYHFPKDGTAYLEEEHPYAGDLNIFGRGSLFQHINATTTYEGEKKLAQLLSGAMTPEERPATAKASAKQELLRTLEERQQAVQELANLLDWRQQFQIAGLEGQPKTEQQQDQERQTIKDPQKIIAWLESPRIKLGKAQKLLIIVLPLLTLSTFILANFQILSSTIPTILLLLQIIYVALTGRGTNSAYNLTEGAVEELQRYAALLRKVEEQSFQAPLLKAMSEPIQHHQEGAAEQLKKLSQIVEWSYFRHSPVLHFILNNLLFWDLHVLQRLEQWKEKNGTALQSWLDSISQFEVLSSLAILAHDHPDWAYPQVVETEQRLRIEAEELGHPLLGNKTRVCNNAIFAHNQTWIITGSNMSGKSTFLRTIGINLVLAYTGAPVCARALTCSPMHIYTSMRIQDDLENHTSTFYAELKRIKAIVDASQQDRPLLFLIDEIFRGTNSKDRIAGAKKVITRLSKDNTIGLVTTHDLELSALAEEKEGLIKNYHFTDRIIENQLHFDYRLREGVSTTTNAMALMKMVGLE
ncbi:MutS family DNA mismatch repair protein [Heliorestis convoluta]|uniref:DNA mismatch repair protein MutS n=1 Tax=Heliorestis convoluta TaxID=356322 RepID=A0A5Q2N4Q4_9FIRM|nr:MutS family DNA mismatch repair protein [Heliorestis convoluta]QGG48913.1 DNA mismatch repair protein MutS [Heliorestis convoluta]